MPPRRHSYRGSPLADVLLSHENVSTFENESVQTKKTRRKSKIPIVKNRRKSCNDENEEVVGVVTRSMKLSMKSAQNVNTAEKVATLKKSSPFKAINTNKKRFSNDENAGDYRSPKRRSVETKPVHQKPPNGKKASSKQKKISFPVRRSKSTRKVSPRLTLTQLNRPLEQAWLQPPRLIKVIDNQGEERAQYSYSKEISDYLKSVEHRCVVPENFISERQPFSSRMRERVVDWMIQVQHFSDLTHDTLHLSVTIMDQFLAHNVLQLPELQLLGTCALMIAGKYQERFIPSIERLIHYTDNTYFEDEIKRMEVRILNDLQFDLCFPVPSDFLNRFLRSITPTHKKQFQHICLFLIDLTMVDTRSSSIRPSLKAAAAVYIALLIKGNADQAYSTLDSTENGPIPWTRTLAHHTKFDEQEVRPTAAHLASLLVGASTNKLQGVVNKFKDAALFSVSEDADVITSPKVHRLAQEDVIYL